VPSTCVGDSRPYAGRMGPSRRAPATTPSPSEPQVRPCTCGCWDATAPALEAKEAGSTRSPSPKQKSDLPAADFTKVRFSGPKSKVRFRVGLRRPSPNQCPIRVGLRSPSPSPSPIRDGLRSPSPTTSAVSATGPRSPSPSSSPIRVGLRSPSPRPKSDSARHSDKADFGCITFCTMIYMCCN
jgi:hypothetical protein